MEYRRGSVGPDRLPLVPVVSILSYSVEETDQNLPVFCVFCCVFFWGGGGDKSDKHIFVVRVQFTAPTQLLTNFSTINTSLYSFTRLQKNETIGLSGLHESKHSDK